jgi:hypothetical protein
MRWWWTSSRARAPARASPGRAASASCAPISRSSCASPTPAAPTASKGSAAICSSSSTAQSPATTPISTSTTTLPVHVVVSPPPLRNAGNPSGDRVRLPDMGAGPAERRAHGQAHDRRARTLGHHHKIGTTPGATTSTSPPRPTFSTSHSARSPRTRGRRSSATRSARASTANQPWSRCYRRASSRRTSTGSTRADRGDRSNATAPSAVHADVARGSGTCGLCVGRPSGGESVSRRDLPPAFCGSADDGSRRERFVPRRVSARAPWSPKSRRRLAPSSLASRSPAESS